MPSDTSTPKLLLSAREAAESLSVCPKTLWSMTRPRGTIPCVRIGARVLYSVDDLRRWIDRQAGNGQPQQAGDQEGSAS